MGLAKGFPDLFIPVPLGQYHGLMIEMKAENGRLSADQRKWLTYLRDHLYATAVCYSEDEAIAVIKKYKSLETRNDRKLYDPRGEREIEARKT